MIEEQLKRIADALEVIALGLQKPAPLHGTIGPECMNAAVDPAAPGMDRTVEAPKKAKKAKAEKPEANEQVVEEVKAEDIVAMTTDDLVAMVQKAVKINRDATLEVCRKYGYIKTLKDIKADKYVELAEKLAEVK